MAASTTVVTAMSSVETAATVGSISVRMPSHMDVASYFSPRYVLRTRSERSRAAALSWSTMRPVWIT